MTKRWVVYRCWAGNASTMEPQPTSHWFWTRRTADACARRLSTGMDAAGFWYEARRADGVEW